MAGLWLSAAALLLGCTCTYADETPSTSTSSTTSPITTTTTTTPTHLFNTYHPRLQPGNNIHEWQILPNASAYIDDGKSHFIQYEGNDQIYELNRCVGYYNLKRKRCVSEEYYYLPGTCGRLNDDPFDAEFEEYRNFPHLTDCTKYYKPSETRFEYHWCPTELFLNLTTMKCDTETCQEPDQKKQFKCNQENIGKKMLEMCNFYTECKVLHKLTQCRIGMSYNLNSSRCDLTIAENDYCNDKSLFKLSTHQKGIYGLEFDPTLFYLNTEIEQPDGTSKLKVRLRQCPAGKTFQVTHCV